MKWPYSRHRENLNEESANDDELAGDETFVLRCALTSRHKLISLSCHHTLMLHPGLHRPWLIQCLEIHRSDLIPSRPCFIPLPSLIPRRFHPPSRLPSSRPQQTTHQQQAPPPHISIWDRKQGVEGMENPCRGLMAHRRRRSRTGQGRERRCSRRQTRRCRYAVASLSGTCEPARATTCNVIGR